jgi:hypothetical protein
LSDGTNTLASIVKRSSVDCSAANLPAKRIGFTCQAPVENCTLIPVAERSFQVPHRGPGSPGQASVFYPELSSNTRIVSWLSDVRNYIAGRSGTTAKPSRGWSISPDAAHNAAVEAAAIAHVLQRFGPASADRQKEKCGWDLEFVINDKTRCVEVKGLSDSEIHVELTPNEFCAAERAMNNTFTEGDYRLAVVCNALSDEPTLYVFSHDTGMHWRCELSGHRITAIPRIAAYFE